MPASVGQLRVARVLSGVAHDALVEDDPATHLGRQLRRGRHAAHRTQQDVAADVGLSQPVISRMELGGGGRIGLDVWAAAAEAVGLRLEVDFVDAAEQPEWSGWPHPCLAMLVDFAARGGWSVLDAAAPEHQTTALGRHSLDARRFEIAIIRVWPTVTRVDLAIEAFRQLIEQARHQAPETDVSGVVLVPATYANRRCMTESRNDLRPAFPVTGRAWFGALASRIRPMPEVPGILWAFPDCERLRPAPFLPGWVWTVPGDGPRFMRPRRERAT
jgi:transcriptional regulator with XRE-family HTH domain